MAKREVVNVTFPYQENALNELNLIGLKGRYALNEKPEECKSICLKREIKFNRIFGRNIFIKVNQGKHTFRDFDHIIVPRYTKKKMSLHQYIQKEMNQVDKVNELKKVLPQPNPIRMFKLSSTREAAVKKELPVIPQRREGALSKREALGVSSSLSSIDINSSMRMMSSRKCNSSEDVASDAPYSFFFNKNDSYITSKGGIMNKASVWRLKNMNHLVKFLPRRNEQVNDNFSQGRFHLIKPKYFKIRHLSPIQREQSQ